MSYKEVEKLEIYLRSIKKKTPPDISFARTHLMLIKDEIGNEELRNIKILYQSKLDSTSTMANYLAIFAIVTSSFLGVFTLDSSGKVDITSKILFTFYMLFLTVIMYYMLYYNSQIHKRNVTYTIIIEIIDELLETKNGN